MLAAVLLGLLGAGVPEGRTARIFADASAAFPDLEAVQRSVDLVQVSTIAGDGLSEAVVAFYDDPHTPRANDYVEVYDAVGNLLAVAWFDRYGIRRVAVERALLEGESRRRGDFVLLLHGDSL